MLCTSESPPGRSGPGHWCRGRTDARNSWSENAFLRLGVSFFSIIRHYSSFSPFLTKREVLLNDNEKDAELGDDVQSTVKVLGISE